MRVQVMRGRAMGGFFPFLARLMIAAIFVQGAFGKLTGWDGQAAYMRSHGLPFIPLLLGLALAIEGLGTVCLVVGFQTRITAAIMCVYLLAVSVLLHNFWAVQNAGMQQTHFFKNLAICGGLLMVAVFGAGEWSMDARRAQSGNRHVCRHRRSRPDDFAAERLTVCA